MNPDVISPISSLYPISVESGVETMTTDSDAVVQGYLQKSPPLGKRGLKIWHKRWVILRHDRKLYYYRTERATEPLGVIDITSCIRLDCGLDHKKYRHIFAIVCKDRTHFFSAPSESGMEGWVSAICHMRSTEYGLCDTFRPVWRPSRHSWESGTGNEGGDTETSNSSPLLRIFKRSLTVLSPKQTALSKGKRSLSVDTFRLGSETPPPVDRSSKPPPPVHRHLKPQLFQAQSPGGTDSALSSAGHSSSSVEGEVFKFPVVDNHQHQSTLSVSPSPGSDRLNTLSLDSSLDAQKCDDLFPAWPSLCQSQESPPVHRASVLGGSVLFQAESITSIDEQLSPVQGSSCDSGAESEEGGMEEPVSTKNTRTYHYHYTTDEDLSDNDSPSKASKKAQWSSATNRSMEKQRCANVNTDPLETEL